MRWWVLALPGALGACDDIPRARSKVDIQNIAVEAQADQLAGLRSEIADLQRKLREVEAENTRQNQFAVDTYNSLTNLRTTFNSNVDQRNREKAHELTKLGGCGQERYFDDAGYPRIRNKPCTVNDLR